MKRNICFSVLAALVLVSCLFAGCTSSPKVPTQNVLFEEDADAWVRYCTNDKYQYGRRKQLIFDNANSDPNVYEMDIKRISGFENMSAGMAFGAVDDNNYYSVTVSATGNFIVRKISGTTSELVRKDNYPSVNKGYNVVNTLKVVKNGNHYDVFVNNNTTADYTVTDTSIKGSKIGYYLIIGDSGYEKFPDIPVEVYFKVK
ncbi:hypothetical protein LJC14_00335 [Treponema sp. OttesenSCG-928-L16]|nr:hypothetical protein [Treponema sp. OttesenSCG-928-L16]